MMKSTSCQTRITKHYACLYVYEIIDLYDVVPDQTSPFLQRIDICLEHTTNPATIKRVVIYAVIRMGLLLNMWPRENAI